MRSSLRKALGLARVPRVGSGLARPFGVVLNMLLAICTLSATMHAKVDAGISGIVTDSTGAVVSGATVKVTAIDTGLVQTRQTNVDGFYAFVDLPPGNYDIEITQSGFGAFRQKGILLDVNSAKVVNVKLNVGQISETVEISADQVTLDTASTQNGEVIRAQTITSVPLVTRSYTDLLALQPGVTPVSSGLA